MTRPQFACYYLMWLGLAPKHEISGGKVLKNKMLKTKNRLFFDFGRNLRP